MGAEDVSSGSSGKIIKIDENLIRGHLDQVVRGTVEETLNALLDAEADQLCQAEKYERLLTRLAFQNRPHEAHTADSRASLPATTGRAVHG